MRRAKRVPYPDAEKLARFRVEVMELYRKFEEDLVRVSRKFGFEINMWYSPSRIPQPNFRAGRLFLDVDQLYHDQDFRELISQHYPVWNVTSSPMRDNKEMRNGTTPTNADAVNMDLVKKNVELREERPDLPFDLGHLDFRQDGGDLRVRRSKPNRGYGT